MGIFFKRKKNWGGSQNLPQNPEPTILTKKWEPPNTGTYPSKHFLPDQHWQEPQIILLGGFYIL